jgi:AraC-like DNA-binding protein
MRDMGTNNSFNEYRAERAVALLVEDIVEIRNVDEWASRACMSSDWLRKSIKKKYNKSPKEILREVRFEMVAFLIKDYGWKVNGDGVAMNSGVGKNSKALHKFLKRNYDITFTELREKILKSGKDVKIVWLNKKVL